MFFVYFDRNECCCSAKIWSVVIKNKPVFVACVARIVRACEWIPSFFLLDCEMFKQAHIHTQDDGNKTKILLHSFTKCCKHCCLYTFPIIYIHIYIHTLCTLYYCHCRLRSCHIDGETWCCAFFFPSSSAPFLFRSFFVVRSGRKKMFLCLRIKIVVLSQLFLQNVHSSHVGMKKKSTKFIVWFFFVLI